MSVAVDEEEVSPAELLDLIGRATDGSDVTPAEVAEFLAAGHDARTERRVLAWLAKVGKRARKLVAVDEPDAEVVIAPAHRGRITGYSLRCEGCDLVAPKLASSRRMAQLAAIGHLRSDHDSIGTIRDGSG